MSATVRRGPFPTVLVALGAVLALLGAALFAAGLWGSRQGSVVAADGSPGALAIATGSVPGTLSVELGADQGYTVYVAWPAGSVPPVVTTDVQVTSPGGRMEALRPTGAVAVEEHTGSFDAGKVVEFHADSAGTYTVRVPAASQGQPLFAAVVYRDHHSGFWDFRPVRRTGYTTPVQSYLAVFGALAGGLVLFGLGAVLLGVALKNWARPPSPETVAARQAAAEARLARFRARHGLDRPDDADSSDDPDDIDSSD